MKRLPNDRIALVTAGIGIVLMIMTTMWRVNPVEGSVVPDYLTRNPFGQALLFVLLVTCMPVWIPTVFLAVVLASFVGIAESESFGLANGAAVIVQGIVYLMFGKLISIWVEWFRTKKSK